MSIDDKKKKELEERIKEQRRSVWKGESSSKKTKRRRWSDLLSRKNSHQKQQKQKDDSREKPLPTPSKPEQNEKITPDNDVNELKQKIVNQRRAVWKGESLSQEQTNKSDEKVYSNNKREITFKNPSNAARKVKIKKTRSKLPPLKLALIVLISLIACVSIGIVIGYIIANYNLLN
ncbi:hypothetical protein GF312_07520 [Candidatus Poribacteria bacterium]|nr:hypothetical protein [Candidatus Poribacteria bacterium]